MVRERFDESFERLRDQSNRLAETERSPDNLDEIVAERVELDRLRRETTAQRKKIVSRFEPPAPTVVEPPRGPQHTGLFGKIAAAVSVGLLVVAGFFAVRFVQAFGNQFPLTYVDVVERVDPDRCRWQLAATVRNDSSESVQIERVEVVLRRRLVGAPRADYPILAPGASTVIEFSYSLATAAPCPVVEEVDHGNLIMHLDNQQQVSRGF